MTILPKAAKTILTRILEGIEKPGDSKVLDYAGPAPAGYGQPNFMALHVECIADDHFSLAHYGKQYGDTMRDPEVIFWRNSDGEFLAYYYRNDYLGIEQNYIDFGPDGEPVKVQAKMQEDLTCMAVVWLNNIKEQQGLSDIA